MATCVAFLGQAAWLAGAFVAVVVVNAVGVVLIVVGVVLAVVAVGFKCVLKVAATADPVAAIVAAVLAGVACIFKTTLMAVAAADPVTTTAFIGGVVAVVIDWARRAMVNIRRARHAREAETERQRQTVLADKVGRCRWTISIPVLTAPMISALETIAPTSWPAFNVCFQLAPLH